MNELDPSKLTSVDEHGDRVSIIPAEVNGFFRRHRNWVQGVLLVVFLLLPWTHIGGRQTILLNIPDREFALFGVLFRAHDAPMIFFLFGILTLGLAFVTAVWGRVWCGWACPQTVFIDAVYRRIEQWVEGGYIERRRLRDGPMNAVKIRKLVMKWFLFFVVSSLIAHSFMAYFVGAEDLVAMMMGSPSENYTYFILVSIFTAAILFDFAWFREQFCVIMCPYGRIQSLLLDQKSMVVMYDAARGEPRKSRASMPNMPTMVGASTGLGATAAAAVAAAKQGDCVSCNRCVQVCPTGIDIRNGLQMECIACTACIDACDEIMEKVKKPTGLIRYDTLDGSKISLWRPRSLIYLVMIIGLVLGLAFTLATREPVDWTLMRSKGLPYSYIKDETGSEKILNQFKIHIQNQGKVSAYYNLSLPAEIVAQGFVLTTGQPQISLAPEQSHEWYFFVSASEESLKSQNGKIKTKIILRDEAGFESQKELILVGPKE
jgi:cytochrome c oxidase accessory protein FixG